MLWRRELGELGRSLGEAWGSHGEPVMAKVVWGGPCRRPRGPGQAGTAWELSGKPGGTETPWGAQGSLREAWTQGEPGGAHRSSGLVNLGEAMGALGAPGQVQKRPGQPP